ncbi:radical SAM/SPASM domain-containing protein [Candidatus Acidianus copahuensis]|uniref:radical SAM/SPASM domain-containing protein n=1 Tax=Acidianus TaxID=12914 RepID=UPI00064E533E|nr:radical SAM protein [Candidatus Acidianus copahuensis]
MRWKNTKLSKFNIFLYNENIIFNTLTGYAIKVSEEQMEKLNQGEVPEDIRDIIEEGFSDQEFDPEKMVLKKNVLEPTLLLTYDCNFDCAYCFQKSFRQKGGVRDEVIKGFVNYIRKRINGRKVRVTFFGGEPLLQIKKIEEISQQLKDLDYSFSVVTNGSLLTPSVLDRLMSIGLSHVQITLDGPKEIHDKRRYFVGGKGSFDIILDNLRYAQDYVNVVLRINVDSRNISEVRELFRYLKEKDITKIRVDPHIVHENVFRNEYWENVLPKESEGEVLTKVWEIARDEGYEIPQEVFRLGLCVAHVEDDIVVDPNGLIYPCWAFTGNPLYVKGKLREDGEVEFNGSFSSKRAREVWKGQCEDCPFLPMCMGGCRFFSVLEGRGYYGRDCRKKSYEEVIKLIKYFV